MPPAGVDGVTATTDHVQLAKRATDQIRDALSTLTYAADGWYEDEAQVALDALDWLEEHLGLTMLDLRSHEPPRNSGEGTAVNGPMPLAGGDESLTDEHE
jgi:hypothetical protein